MTIRISEVRKSICPYFAKCPRQHNLVFCFSLSLTHTNHGFLQLQNPCHVINWQPLTYSVIHKLKLIASCCIKIFVCLSSGKLICLLLYIYTHRFYIHAYIYVHVHVSIICWFDECNNLIRVFLDMYLFNVFSPAFQTCTWCTHFKLNHLWEHSGRGSTPGRLLCRTYDIWRWAISYKL